MFEVLNNEETVNELAKENPSLLKKIVKAIEHFLDELKKVMGSLPWAEAKVLKDDEQALKDIRWMFNKALDNTNKNTAREDGGVKYSIRLTDDDLSDYLRAGNRKNKNKLAALENNKKIILTSNSEIVQYIDSSIDKTTEGLTVAYGKVNDRLAKEVSEYSNGQINIDDDYLELVPYNIQHSFEEHHHAKAEGDIDLDRTDFENIPEYIDTYDELLYAIKYSSGNTKICVSKVLPNGRILIIETVSKSRGALQFKNAIGITEEKYQNEYVKIYKNRSGKNTRGSNNSNNSLRDLTTSDNRISQNDTPVNTQSMQKTEKDEIKKSLQSIDKKYMTAVENGDMETAQKYVDKAAADSGYTIRAYHGTSRGDRVGNVFLPERATSGPMAFFTSSKDIAENYARDKADTSISYDEMYDDYTTQFRVIHNGENISVSDYWSKLPFSKKLEIKEKAKHVTFDDDAENIVYDNSVQYGSGGFDAYRINSNNGNILAALTEEWLIDGQLYGEEHKFLDVLKLVGINDVKYYNPNERHEKVYDTYLKIENPFRTEDADASFAELLLEWFGNQPEDKYEKESADADMWDKNNRSADEWVEEKLMDDIRNGTSHAWTSIPDAVTDYLKSLGHDGIFDIGGKNGGETHTVYIPFSSEQIKSAETVTYDDNGDVIPLNKRFNSNKSDIRFSFQSVDKKSETEYNKRRKKGSYFSSEETEFKIWQNRASIPIGDVEFFRRLDKKIHYYEKTEDGCIEITQKEFDYKKHKEDSDEYDRTKVKANSDIEENEASKRGNIESDAVYGYSSDGKRDAFSVTSSEFQNEQSGNQESSWRDNKEASEIKFSLQETARASETREQLLKENGNLRVANNVLRNELKLTKGKTISMIDAQSLARKMIREFSSDYDSQALAQKLYDIFRWYDSEDCNADYVVDYISTIAKDVIAQSSARDTSLYDEYEDARKWVRNMRFALPEHVLRQLNENHDGKFRQKTFGRMQLVSKEKNPDVMYLSAMYSELAEAYPMFFSVEDNEYEQPQKLLDFWEAVQPTYADTTKEMGFESEDAAAVGFAYMTFEKYLAIPAHQTYADKKQKEIDSLKKEYSRNLNEAKKKLREERDAKVEETKQYYRDMIDRQRVKRMETQAKAALRKDVITKVKKLSDMLTKPTDKKHIPDQLKNMVAKYLMLFTDDSAIFNEAVINRVTKAYTQLIEEDDGAMEGIRQYYDPDILKKLNRLAEIAEAITDGNRLAQLDAFDMNTIAEITDHFYHLVTNANEVFIGEKKKNFNDIVTEIMIDMHGQKSKSVRASFEATSWNMTPYYFFKKIGGMFNELFTDLLDGQHKYGLLMAQAREHMQALGEKYKISSWQGSNKAIIEFTAGNGEEVKLTADEALGIYAIAKREAISGQESKHLTEGGIVFKGKEAIPISYEEITRITNTLTREQLAYADEAIEYLSTVVGGWGNEASLKMFGYKKFNESWYYPFHTAENYKRGNSEDDQKTAKAIALIKNKSFTKSTVYGANTPVKVENFTDVVGDHIAEMISYNTMAQAQSTLNAVFKYNVKNNSVRAALEEAYGGQAKAYVETLIKDITSGATYDPNEGFANKMISKFKMNAVAANLSVIVQQPAAVGRALAVIDPKYLLTKSPKGGYEECKKYAGVAVIKEIGGFDTSTGSGNVAWIMKATPEGVKNKAKAFWKDSDYRNDKFGWAAGKMDELTWAYIWQAVKAETADKLNVEVSELTEKQLYEAGKRFNEVIEATQVYDSVLTRSQFMRGKTTWTKMASAFMAEPTKRINMLYDAFYEYTINKDKESGKYLMRTIGGVLVATVINTVLKSFISAGRDDDENQAYMEKYVEALIDNAFSELSIMQGLPIIKDIVSIMQGYDITRTDMDIVINAVDAVGSMVKFTNTVNDGEYALMTDKEKFASVAEMIYEFFGSLGAFAGLPTKNIGRDLVMLADIFKSVIDDKKPTSTGMKYSSSDALIGVFDNTIGNPLENIRVNEKDLYKDMLNDDMEAFALDWDKYQAYLIYSGKTEEKAYSAVRSNVKELIKANLYRSKITDEEAERYLIEYLGNEDGYWVVKEWRFDADEQNEGVSFSKYLELEEAVLAGEDISDEVKELTDHNTKEKNVQNKVTNIIKDAFDEDKISETEAQTLLTKYVGFAANQSFITNSIESETDINRIVDKWSGNKELPDGEYYTSFDALKEAVIDGTSIEGAKERLYELDYSDSEINEQIRSSVKESYLDGSLTRSEASKRLQKYTDMSSDDAADKLNYWNFKNSNPDSELSEAGVKKYLEAKESGISLDVFEGYYSKVTKITGDKDSSGETISGSKKAKILDLINSLPLSSKQKDILYYQNGYGASTLYSAPWH